ncbi:hypothetical protein ANN_27714 [Periplaneta americana]|uniref:Uncharacterized protein n=1 Tax=Periplaneta americana TaxID=6978 RepID=A0ABQ8RVD4_PERAM|nr:hypothetical protein ANN_27714 [Periplaneta americana]
MLFLSLSSHTMTERPLSNAQLVSIVNSYDSEEFISEFEDNVSYEFESENDDDFDSQQPVNIVQSILSRIKL